MVKILMTILLLAISLNIHANESLIKSCKANFTTLLSKKNVSMDIKIMMNSDQKVIGKVSQVVNGFSGSYGGPVTILEFPVRENIFSEPNRFELNEGEKMILNSDYLVNEASFKGRFH